MIEIEDLKSIKERLHEIEAIMYKPETLNDMKAYAVYSKEYKKLSQIVEIHTNYERIVENIKEAKAILYVEKEEAFRELAKQELAAAQIRKAEVEMQLRPYT